jgi:hypothetical protein
VALRQLMHVERASSHSEVEASSHAFHTDPVEEKEKHHQLTSPSINSAGAHVWMLTQLQLPQL